MKGIQAPSGARRTGTLEPKSMPANERLGGMSQATRSRRTCDLCGRLEAEPLPDLFLCPSCEREKIDRVTGEPDEYEKYEATTVFEDINRQRLDKEEYDWSEYLGHLAFKYGEAR